MSPAEVAARWPADKPLLWLHSGRAHPRWARWSLLATARAVFRHDRRSWLTGHDCPALQAVRLTHDPLQDLDLVLAATATTTHSPSGMATGGGWIGYFSYDLGRVIEPTACHVARPAGWPLIELAWCPDMLLFDHFAKRWRIIGEAAQTLSTQPVTMQSYRLGSPESTGSDVQYCAAVERTINLIAAGDVFQANIARTCSMPFAGSTRALAIEALEQAKPWYGAYLELPGDGVPGSRCLLSLSPELFLRIDSRDRHIVTRPVKGTRAADGSLQELRDSPKEQAELSMIVDLMRNDLGRICDVGSIRVPQPRAIEEHPTVQHGVAEITGRLRRGIAFSDVLRAMFPPGSVTGAPKIRAMQIIDELEEDSRGPYCGAIGFIGANGNATLNVAIRTLMIDGCGSPGGLDARAAVARYWAGAGIVADSTPQSELQETRNKTAVVRMLAQAAAYPPAHRAIERVSR